MSEQEALAHHRDALHAQLLVEQIGLAALTHPELLQKALASVFDMKAVEAQITRIMASLLDAQRLANQTWNTVNDLDRQVAQLRDKMLALEIDKELDS